MDASICAWIALGSNLGDRIGHFGAARRALEVTPGVSVVAASRIYETEPVGPPGQGPYLNAVLALDAELSPRALLARLLAIEVEQGRVRDRDAERWGPRPLDLDLLLYGDLCRVEEGLEIPHPRLHERAFVLEPLCEVAGDRRHPRSGIALAALREGVADPLAVRPFAAAQSDWRVGAVEKEPGAHGNC
ncbi:MAG: 2-amino-4-hydroxy-6-hydroxymethyldihydropteridine diphosphokinase [Myxococcota bacterium]|nr:2-amino-4-hydroxy-6-hydroxymethyldihydropteridine diphosphokinase [Myxococcota bacterium]